ncbi:hypothetical protein Tco_1119014 [Tanacetum coccineum]
MIFESVKHGPLIWPTVEENGVIRRKKYAELSAAEKIQADCDMKATNITSLQHLSIILQQSSPSTTIFTITIWITSTQSTLLIHLSIINSTQSFSCSTITYISVSNESSNLIYSIRDDPIACLNKAMDFLTTIAFSRFPSTNNQLRTSSNLRNQVTIQDVQGEILQVDRQEMLNATTVNVKDIWLGNALSLSDQGMPHDPGIPVGQAQTIIPHNAAFQTEDLNTYDSEYDDLSTIQAVLMANISNYGSDIISEVPNSETYLNDMDNQSVHALQDFEQSPVMDFIDNEISSDSNIIPYSQYLQETQQANKEQKNESITAELERYKERVKTFEQHLNIDLSCREKMIDS